MNRSIQLAIVAGTLALVTFAIYYPGLGGGFVFDDYSNIVFNVPLRVSRLTWDDWMAAAMSSPSRELRRPLAMLTFAANEYLTGLDPWWMKLTNLLLHTTNALLAYGLVRSIVSFPTINAEGVESRAAALVAFLWASLPINFIAVLLVVQRMESLANLFVLGGLWLYSVGRMRQIRGEKGWFHILCGVLGGSFLGVLCKESAALLPLYVLLLEACIFRFSATKRIARSLRVFFGVLFMLGVGIGIVWLLPKVLGPEAFAHRNFGLSQRLMTEPAVLLDYLRWTLLPNPSELSLFHDAYPVVRNFLSSPKAMLGVVTLTGMAGLAVTLRKRRPLISLGLSWWLVAHLLTATIIPLELVFEHRNYFASMGLMLAVVDLLVIAPSESRRTLALVVCCGMLAFYGFITHLRALEWSDPVRFAMSEAEKHPDSPRATYHLGQTLATAAALKPDSPLSDAALAAFERAMQVPGSGINAEQGALILASRTGRRVDRAWWWSLQEKLRLRPIGPQEMSSLGAMTDCAIVRRCSFTREDMVNSFSAALSQGDKAEILNIYGNYSLNVLNNADLAEELWKKAIRLDPREPQYIVGLAKLMIAESRGSEARHLISSLRALGSMGEFENLARDLESRQLSAEHIEPKTRATK